MFHTASSVIGFGVTWVKESGLRDIMRALGNATYLAIDSVPLPVLAVLFFFCAVALQLMHRADKHLLLPYTITSPLPVPSDAWDADPFVSKRHSTSHSYFDLSPPISPRYVAPGTPQMTHTMSVPDMVYLHPQQQQQPLPSYSRRGSRGRATRASLGTVTESEEEV